MSNLLKSKILVGVFAFALMFAGFVAVNTANAATCDMGMTTLRQGSKSEAVKCLQQTLNAKGFTVSTMGAGSMGMETTTFGPATKAAVMSFQASSNLVADGVVGAMTKGALNAAMPTTPTNLPEGCMSTSGFSTTTGQPCSTTTNLPAGCTSTVGYSSTTGAKCDSTTTTPTPSKGFELNGTAGDATLTQTSVDVESEVEEGSTEKVLGFRAEAKDSDIQLTNLKLTIENIGSGSTRPDRYLDEVSVWMGNTKVGSVKPSDMTRTNSQYSKSIALNNVVVKEGSENRQNLYVGFTALQNIDSTDLNNATFSVNVDNVRFIDQSGSIVTETNVASVSNVTFTDLANSGDVKLKTQTSNTPVAGNVEVSDSGSTSGVELLSFSLRGEGTPMSLDRVTVNVTGTGATPGQIASELKLMHGDNTVADLTSLGSNGTKAFDLYDDFMLSQDKTEVFKVVAKVNTIGTTTGSGSIFDQGDSLQVDLVSTASSFGTLEDKNGDAVTTVSGSATGEAQTFYSEGLVFTKKSQTTPTVTTDQNGNITSATYTMRVGVTAFGNTFYVGQSVQAATTGSSTNAFAYWLEDSTAPTTAVVTGTQSATVSSNATVVGSSWRLDEGTEREFTITVNLVDPSTAARSWRVQLGSMRTFTDSGLTADATNRSLSPVTDFETAYQFINS